jgi:exopolysaccharide production protein ExoZ
MAAILVVLYHTSHGIFRLERYFGHEPFGPIFDFGFAGVDFFFVLSGFIMMHVHADDLGQPRALGAYLGKRFSRIYPAYWVVLAAMVPVYFLVPDFGIGHEREPGVILRAIVLFPHPETHLVLGVAWTLVYEVFFYLLFGLLILDKRIGMLVFVGWTACVLAYPWFENYPWNFLFSYLHLRFLAGMAVAVLLRRWQVPAPRLVAFSGAALFLGAGMVEAFVRPLSALEQTLGYALGSAVALAGLIQAERSGLIQPPRWLVYLGNASYAIYLVHFLALSMIAKIAKASHLDVHVPGTLLFCVHVAGAIASGCVFHHLVEHPIHAWAKRLFRSAKTRPPAAVVAEPETRQAA